MRDTDDSIIWQAIDEIGLHARALEGLKSLRSAEAVAVVAKRLQGHLDKLQAAASRIIERDE